MLRREVNTMYARVAAAPEGYLPNPTAQNSSLRQQFLRCTQEAIGMQ